MKEDKEKAIPVNRLCEILDYDKHSGKVYNKKTQRLISPDETGSVTIYDPLLKTKRKMKLDALAWALFHKQEIPNSYKILHKDLNKENNSAINLVGIIKTEYAKVSEALNNLQHYMKIQLHPNDQYKYVLQYRINGIERKETFNDIIEARNAKHDLEVMFAKIVNRYAISI